MIEFETRTVEQLPRQVGAVATDLVPVQRPGGPVQAVPVGDLVNSGTMLHQRTGATVPARPVGSRLDELTVNAREFGMIGDKFVHSLASVGWNAARYGSDAAALTAARDYYGPDVTSLDNLVDGLAVNKALQFVKQRMPGLGGRVAIAGSLRCNTGSIRIPNGVGLVGEAAGTLIDNQNTPVGYPLIVNEDPANAYGISAENLVLLGGSHGIKIDVTGECAGLGFRGVSMSLQGAANFQVSTHLQTTAFEGCGFSDSPRGFVAEGGITNHVGFELCTWSNHSREHVVINGGEGIVFDRPRFEGAYNSGTPATTVSGSIANTVLTLTSAPSGPVENGMAVSGAGVLPGTLIVDQLSTTSYVVNKPQTVAAGPLKIRVATIRLANVGSWSVTGGYFESVHELLLHETAGRAAGGGFDASHFTAASAGAGFVPFLFDSDTRVRFGSNEWVYPSTGPAKMLMLGENPGALDNPDADLWTAKTGRQGRGVSRARWFAAASTFDLLRITRANDATSGMLTVKLRVTMRGERAADGLPRVYAQEFNLTVFIGPALPLAIPAVNGSPVDYGQSGFTIGLEQVATGNTALLIRVACSGGNAQGSTIASASVEYEATRAFGAACAIEFA